MYSLRIHSIDVPNDAQEKDSSNPWKRRILRKETIDPAMSDESSPSSAKAMPVCFLYPKIEVTKGLLHLYRNVSEPPASFNSVPAARGTLLLVLAVPSRMSYDDLCEFCGSYVEYMLAVRVIRDDATEDRYSILINFDEQRNADGFYRSFNVRRFPSAEVEVCHILYCVDVRYSDSNEIAGTPPQGLTELPTCPICLERLDQDISGIPSTPCKEHSNHCSCITKWSDSSCPVCQFCQQQAEKPVCSICGTSENLWICLICGFVGCGRYKEGHAVRHWRDTHHSYSLDLETQRLWDYVGDNYVHRTIQAKSDGKLVELDYSCTTVNDGCRSCECSEDSGISAALYSSTVESIVDEYSSLLGKELENQREYYENLLANAKEQRYKTTSDAIDNAITSEMENLQLELNQRKEENKTILEENKKLIKDQNCWKKIVQEAQQRVQKSMISKDAEIRELEEELRDMRVHVSAREEVQKLPNADDIEGGTVLPAQPGTSPSKPKSKRSSKTHKKT